MAAVQIVLLGRTYFACACEIEKCSHVWLSERPDPPARCSSCKSSKWNPGGIPTPGILPNIAERLKTLTLEDVACLDCLSEGDVWGFENYMVTDEVWALTRIDKGHICIPHLQKRLNRRLTIEDFTDAPANNHIRLGYEMGAGNPKTSGEIITDLSERLQDIHPPAELGDGEPYRVSESKPRSKPEKGDTLTANLCTHGLYKPLCHRPH